MRLRPQRLSAPRPRRPGRTNRGNATQAIAAAVAMGADPALAAKEVGTVGESPPLRLLPPGQPHHPHTAGQNPAGWQEALSMIDQDADSLVIAVNGQVPDGEDLSWLWDVRFEAFETMKVIASVNAPPTSVCACCTPGRAPPFPTR